ncbi:cytochrome c [Acetobacteraceae bacterium ESL0709]|nr:cytochrome c [Acetobacteraceae bacterium ESL0697]MDF7677263.1 cytochrome c [Acetobacteraceae bacterium ESL0709]
MKAFSSFSSVLTIGAAVGYLLYSPTGLAQSPSEQDLVKQGDYIARASDCMACHTTKEGKPFAGGLVLKTPFGKIVSSNITPSKKFGIGGWTETQFANAVRKGSSPRLGHLYPAMPYTAYAGLSDRDMHALYVYFTKAVEPVEKEPETKTALSFPYNIRFAMVGWNMLYASGRPMADNESTPDGSRRGEYLVKVLAHCGTCHTPRNKFMAEKSSDFLAGNPNIQGWVAPNITSDNISGIGGWSEEEIIAYLKNGAAHGKAQAAGPMAEAVEYSLRYLTDSDLKAVATYLKTVKPISNLGQTKANHSYNQAIAVDSAVFDYPIDRSPLAMGAGSSIDGQRLYLNACATCHQPRGEGTEDQFYPSLTSNSVVGAKDPRNLVMAILYGVDRQTNDGHVFMPGFAEQLSDEQITAIAQYVATNFGNPALKVTINDVKLLRNASR